MKRVKLDISYIICNSSIKSICFKNFSILFFRFLVFTRLNYLWSFAIALLETMAKAFGNCIGYRIDFATICTKLERSYRTLSSKLWLPAFRAKLKCTWREITEFRVTARRYRQHPRNCSFNLQLHSINPSLS